MSRPEARSHGSVEDELDWTSDPDGWAAEVYFEEDFWDIPRRQAFLVRIADLAPNDNVLGMVGAQGLEDWINVDAKVRAETTAIMDSLFVTPR